MAFCLIAISIMLFGFLYKLINMRFFKPKQTTQNAHAHSSKDINFHNYLAVGLYVSTLINRLNYIYTHEIDSHFIVYFSILLLIH